MSVDVVCGKCGERVHTMKMLKSIKDVVAPYDNKCPSCGTKLSTSEFTVEAQEN